MVPSFLASSRLSVYAGRLQFKAVEQLHRRPQGRGAMECNLSLTQTRGYNKEGDLRELIINGLASLISANPEYGVKHCLPMTFDADPAMRVVFAHAFARVVGQGLKFEKPIQTSTNKQSKLCEVRSAPL